jgi:hypothetical protein
MAVTLFLLLNKTTATMDQQQLFVKMALLAWQTHIKRANTLFDSFTDEQLMNEVAPGRNRVIYLLGHLTAVHDAMLTVLGLGDRSYARLDEAFIKNPDKTVASLPAAGELRAWWKQVNERLNQLFDQLPAADWFQKHTLISDEDFAREPHRNRLGVLLNRTNHLSSHIGQLALVKSNQ